MIQNVKYPNQSHPEVCKINSVTSPVQPVWCDAPIPAPVSP